MALIIRYGTTQHYQIITNLSAPPRSGYTLSIMKRFQPTVIVNIIGGLLALWILIALVQTIKHNYDLEKQIETLRQQIAVLQAQNDELSYRVAYYNTDSFKQREARTSLGLQMPGENVIVLPSPSPSPTPPPTDVKAKHSNFRQWIDFLSGRG